MTRVRLPDTEVPAPERGTEQLDGQVDELAGLLVSRNNGPHVLAQAEALLSRCDEVVAVDQGSSDDTVERLQAAGVRVLRLPAPQGEGAALRAGMQLARELGYIGVLVPGPEVLEPEAVDVLALAHKRAPEAMFMGVGPGEAVAGQEWVEAAMVAEGLEPPPLSDFKPPLSGGLIGRVELTLKKLVETRFSHPWGSPRVLPLQAMLRRDIQCSGPEFHLECLFLAVLAGIPTIEVELGNSPQRRSITCRKTGTRLLIRMLVLLARRRFAEGMGMGGGYAPPTTSPLTLLLATGLALATALPASGCVRQVSAPVAAELACEAEMPRGTWPGAGEPEAAWQQELDVRASRGTLWMQQNVVLDEPGPAPMQRLQGALIFGGQERLRLRLFAPFGVMALDLVVRGQDWQLSVPTLKLQRRGRGELPSSFEDAQGRKLPLRVKLLASLLQGARRGESVAWQSGACAVLEEFDAAGVVARRLAWQQGGGGWHLAREELLEAGELLLVASYSDYRLVGDANSWPHLLELRDAISGSTASLETTFVRSDGVTDEFFAMAELGAASAVLRE